MTDAGIGAISRGSVARVGVATTISAVCGWTVLYLAARALNPAGFSVFGVFWGAFGLVNGAAYGLLQEATREVRSAGYVQIIDGVIISMASAPGRNSSITRCALVPL